MNDQQADADDGGYLIAFTRADLQLLESCLRETLGGWEGAEHARRLALADRLTARLAMEQTRAPVRHDGA